MFRCKFKGWDDVIKVDHTRTAESVQRRGADLKAILERDQMKADLTALFQPRQPRMSDEEAEDYLLAWQDDFDGKESFVFEDKKYGRLPEEEEGELGFFFVA